MATAPEEIIDPNAVDPNAEDPNAAPAGEESNGENSPYAPLAKDMGWVPKDQFQGNPEEWKPADQFIRDGRDIQRETARELKNVRSQLETVARTSASIVEQQVKERVDQLTQQYNKAVEDGDPQEAFKLSREIDKTINSKPEATVAPSSEAAAFAERNASWFQKPGNEYATARAIEICNTLAAQGYTDHGTQLRIAEQRLKQEMPQLFGQQQTNKPAPGVNAPSSRGAPPSNRQKGYADLPPEVRKIADDFANRGAIKDEGNLSAKEIYARNYFANLQGKA